jgi:hypothetical protein
MNAPDNSRALAVQDSRQHEALDLFTPAGFDLANRIAKAYANSNAVPAQFRLAVTDKKGKVVGENLSAIGNCIVAIETARAVGMSITSVMQQANIIEGKLTWSAQFVIAAINASGRFTPLQFTFESRGVIKASYKEKLGWNEQKGGFDFAERTVELEDVVCRAWAYAKDGGKVTARIVTGPQVSMKMAVEEGWYGKSGSKWQGEMAQLMLTYRAGSFFGRIYAPDVVMGMGQTTEERIDTLELTPTGDVELPAGPFSPPTKGAPARQRDEPAAEDAVILQQGPPELVPTAGQTVATPEGDRGPGVEPEPTPLEELQASVAASTKPKTIAEPDTGELALADERQHILARARRNNANVAVLLAENEMFNVKGEALEGLTKDQFKILRKLLP